MMMSTKTLDGSGCVTMGTSECVICTRMCGRGRVHVGRWGRGGQGWVSLQVKEAALALGSPELMDRVRDRYDSLRVRLEEPSLRSGPSERSEGVRVVFRA